MFLFRPCRLLVVVGLTSPWLGVRLSQAQQFDPFQGQAAAYQAQLTRYFASPEAERQARPALLDSIQAFGRDTSWTLSRLGERLDQYEHLLARLRRHQLYRRLSALRDSQDAAARADGRALSAASDDLGTALSQGVGQFVLQEDRPALKIEEVPV